MRGKQYIGGAEMELTEAIELLRELCPKAIITRVNDLIYVYKIGGDDSSTGFYADAPETIDEKAVRIMAGHINGLLGTTR